MILCITVCHFLIYLSTFVTNGILSTTIPMSHRIHRESFNHYLVELQHVYKEEFKLGENLSRYTQVLSDMFYQWVEKKAALFTRSNVSGHLVIFTNMFIKLTVMTIKTTLQ